MTPERIQYFEERLKKPTPEPFASWLRELLDEVQGKASKSGEVRMSVEVFDLPKAYDNIKQFRKKGG